MITKRKVEIFKSFKGEIDQFARFGAAKEKLDISDDDWFLIEDLIHDVELVQKGLAADLFIKRLEIRLKENFDNEEII